jgi:spermidine synthase
MRQIPGKSTLLYTIFVFSGFCGLGYQIVWSRMFALGAGHELPGILATVAAFFGGLSLGAWILDGPVSRSQHPGRWYAGLELVIGFWGLASIPLIPRLNDLTLHLIGLDPSAFRHWTVSFLAPFLVLLPSTLAMGATFPAMDRFLARCAASGRHIGALYAANTLGAVGGTLVGTFVLIEWLGLTRALLLFAAINVVCGFAALAILPESKKSTNRFQPSPATGLSIDPPLPPSQEGNRLPVPQTKLPSWEGPGVGSSSVSSSFWTRELSTRRLNLTIFFTGLLGIAFEVVGARVLAEVLENTIYTFAAVLSIYLLGTAVGAALYQRLGRHSADPLILRFLLFALSTACLLGILVLARAEFIYERSRSIFGDGLGAVLAAEMLVSGSLFGLPTILMGAAFSHLAQTARSDASGLGRAISLNTLGSALAPALFGVVLFPVFGAKWTLVTISLGYLFLLPKISGWQWTGSLVPIILILLLPERLQFVAKPPGGDLLEYRSGIMESVAVVKHFDGNRSLLVNNRFTMGGTGAANAARRHAHIPLLLHPEPKKALFLGVGTGITFAGAGAYSNLEADGVELVPEVLEARHYFEPYSALRPGLRLYAADARRFVRVSTSHYDVVVADLFHPARDGAGALYTLEHFQAIRKRLAPNGLFCQWLPLYQLDEAMLKSITRTFLEVFPQTRAYLLRFNIDTPAIGLIGTLEPTQYSVDWFEKRVVDDNLRKELKSLSLVDGFQLFGSLAANSKALREFSRDAMLNTDDHPIVIFGAPRFSYQRKETAYGRLFTLLDLQAADPSDLIRNGSDPRSEIFIRELSRFIAARDLYLRGLLSESQGHVEEAVNAYVESVRKSPQFSMAYAHCLTLAVQQSKTNPQAARRLLESLAEAQPDRPVARDLLKRLFGE